MRRSIWRGSWAVTLLVGCRATAPGAAIPDASAPPAPAPSTPTESNAAPSTAGSEGAPRAAAPGEAPTSGFAAAWGELHAALRAGRADELVEPSMGLVVLDNPGAFITVERFPSFTAAFVSRPAQARIEACALRAAALPKFSCDNDAWSVEGCILTAASHPALTFFQEAYSRYALDPATPPDPVLRAHYERVQGLATVTVTDTPRYTRWHFGSIDGRWRLLVVDVVVPCSA